MTGACDDVDGRQDVGGENQEARCAEATSAVGTGALEQRNVVRVCVSERVRGDGGGSAIRPVGYTISARPTAAARSNV